MYYNTFKSILSLSYSLEDIGLEIRIKLKDEYYIGKIIGFDAFGKFPEQDNDDDIKFVNQFESGGGNGISPDELKEVFAHKAFETGKTVREIALEDNVLDEEILSKLLDPRSMTEPNS